MSRLAEVIGNVGYILDCLMALRNIHQTGCCNDCRGRSTGCGYLPKPGQMVRYNCPFYQKEEKCTE